MTAHRSPWREPIVWLIVALPLVAVIAGIATLVLAVATDDGLVVDDYYRRGKEINRVLARDEAAAARAMTAALDLDHARGQVAVTLATGSTSSPRAVAPARLHVTLWHATRAGLDRKLDLERASDGVYRGALAPLALGRWHVQLEADDWRLVGMLFVPADTRARLGAVTP